jgi:hypothetical protein
VLLIGEANLPEEACAEIADKIDETGQATAAVKQAVPGPGRVLGVIGCLWSPSNQAGDSRRLDAPPGALSGPNR